MLRLLCLVLLFSLNTYASTKVVVKDSVFQLPGENTTLVNLLTDETIANLPQEALDSLAKIEFSSSLSDGETRSFTRSEYIRLVRESPLAQFKGVTWPSEITVKNKDMQIDQHSVLAFVDKYFAERCPKCRIEVGEITGFSQVPLKYKNWELLLDDMKKNKGMTIVPLVIDGRSIRIKFPLKIWDRVPVAKHTMGVGTQVSKSNIEFVEKSVTFNTKAYHRGWEPIENSVLKRPLKRGQIVTTAHLSKPNIVKAGQKLKLKAGSSSWRISTVVTAKQSGKLGQSIPVRIERTNKTVMAKIISSHVVEVNL